MFNWKWLKAEKPLINPVIATLWVGDKSPVIDTCLHSVDAYAERHGIYRKHQSHLNNTNVPHPAWGKLEVLHWFLDSGYDRMLFMDCDIMVAPDSSNIFEEHPTGIWMRRDPLIERRWPEEFENWVLRNHKKRIVAAPYFNTGVLILDKKFTEKWLEDINSRPKVNHATFEQHAIVASLRLSGLHEKVNWLSSKWNWLNVNNIEANRKEERYFDHYASPDGKKILVKNLKRHIA